MLYPKAINSSTCGTIPSLIESINCQLTKLSYALYNNTIYSLNKPIDYEGITTLLFYKRILTYKYCNETYAEHFTVSHIASKVRLLTSGCKTNCLPKAEYSHPTTTTTLLPTTTTTTTTGLTTTTTTILTTTTTSIPPTTTTTTTSGCIQMTINSIVFPFVVEGNAPDCTSLVVTTDVAFQSVCPITERGVCYNETGSPTISDTTFIQSTSAGELTSIITGLVPGHTYYFAAYAKNLAGTTYLDYVGSITMPACSTTTTTTTLIPGTVYTYPAAGSCGGQNFYICCPILNSFTSTLYSYNSTLSIGTTLYLVNLGGTLVNPLSTGSAFNIFKNELNQKVSVRTNTSGVVIELGICSA